MSIQTKVTTNPKETHTPEMIKQARMWFYLETDIYFIKGHYFEEEFGNEEQYVIVEVWAKHIDGEYILLPKLHVEQISDYIYDELYKNKLPEPNIKFY